MEPPLLEFPVLALLPVPLSEPTAHFLLFQHMELFLDQGSLSLTHTHTGTHVCAHMRTRACTHAHARTLPLFLFPWLERWGFFFLPRSKAMTMTLDANFSANRESHVAPAGVRRGLAPLWSHRQQLRGARSAHGSPSLPLGSETSPRSLTCQTSKLPGDAGEGCT